MNCFDELLLEGFTKMLKKLAIFSAGALFGFLLTVAVLLATTKRLESTLFPNSQIYITIRSK